MIKFVECNGGASVNEDMETLIRIVMKTEEEDTIQTLTAIRIAQYILPAKNHAIIVTEEEELLMDSTVHIFIAPEGGHVEPLDLDVLKRIIENREELGE